MTSSAGGSPRTPRGVAVVGGGIVGLATARALVRAGVEPIVVLEAEDEIAHHQTGHNSGVIHSGLYYEPGSLKAQTCTSGRKAMYQFCDENEVPHRRCGKLVVATRSREVPALEELERRGRANGLDGLCRMSGAEIAERAPGVVGVDGLWVPQTGITDFRTVTEAIAGDVTADGGEVRTGAPVTEVLREARGLRVVTSGGDIETSALVNCAGLQSDRIARMCGVDPGLRIIPFRGDYFEVTEPPEPLTRWPVYPVPDPRLPFLGIHFTPDLDGRVQAGPNAALAFSRHGYDPLDVDFSDLTETLAYPGFWRLLGRYWRSVLGEIARSASSRAFARGARSLAPGVRASDLSPGGSGVRAQAVERDGTLVHDFRMARGERSLHVLNAPSPAATAALTIGKVVAREVVAELLN